MTTDLDCDVLAGERGPSYTDGSQIKNFKIVHVRFVEGLPQSANMRHNSEPSRESPRKKEFRPAPRVAKSSVVPSVSLSQTLKLGKVIVPDANVGTINLEEFSIANMQWLEPFEVTFPFRGSLLIMGRFVKLICAMPLLDFPTKSMF